MVQSSFGLALALKALLVLWDDEYLVAGAVAVGYAMGYEGCRCIVTATTKGSLREGGGDVVRREGGQAGGPGWER